MIFKHALHKKKQFRYKHHKNFNTDKALTYSTNLFLIYAMKKFGELYGRTAEKFLAQPGR